MRRTLRRRARPARRGLRHKYGAVVSEVECAHVLTQELRNRPMQAHVLVRPCARLQPRLHGPQEGLELSGAQ